MDSIIDGLTSDDPEIRTQAFEAAAQSSDDSVVICLIELVQAGTAVEARTSAAGNVREASVVALGRSSHTRASAFLLELIQADDPGQRSLAAIGLAHSKSEASMSALIAALTDKVNSVRNLAERSLLSMIDLVRDRGVAQLLELLNHPTPLTRSPAARLIGLTRDARALEPLLKMLRSDKQWLARMWAAKGLGELVIADAFDALAEAMQADDKNRVRAAAAEAIGKLRAPQSQDLLEKALQDEDGGVRKIAEEALETLLQAGFDEDDTAFADESV